MHNLHSFIYILYYYAFMDGSRGKQKYFKKISSIFVKKNFKIREGVNKILNVPTNLLYIAYNKSLYFEMSILQKHTTQGLSYIVTSWAKHLIPHFKGRRLVKFCNYLAFKNFRVYYWFNKYKVLPDSYIRYRILC